MLFSSTIFLYLFLPLTLLGYYLCPQAIKNYWLLFTSLIFFAWGGVTYTLLLIGSIVVNYILGIQIQRHLDHGSGRRFLIGGVTFNLLLLGVFKYTNFMIGNVNAVTEIFHLPPMPMAKILLPVGISFYTFHALSYLIDIYRGKVAAQRNIFDLALYVSMFSQLVAGPIIRYSDVWQQLRTRTHTLEKFSSGVERFLIGLAKKVLLANVFARVADNIFDSKLVELGAANAWLGIACYSLQIYYDFAGYSDMAIGLGRMFGFEFMENFNFPYLARSITDFWRRWHISLYTFFRDYLFSPLALSLRDLRKWAIVISLLITMLLSGFWHGASWNFVVWGLFHGLFLVLENLGLEKAISRLGRIPGHIYTLLIVFFAFILFRAETLGDAWQYMKALFHPQEVDAQSALFWEQMTAELGLAMLVGVTGAFGLFSWLGQLVTRATASSQRLAQSMAYVYHVGSVVVYAAMLLACTSYLVAGSYNPFIYYRF